MRDSRSYRGTRRSNIPRLRQTPYDNYRARRSRKVTFSLRKALFVMIVLMSLIFALLYLFSGNGLMQSKPLFSRFSSKDNSESLEFNLPFGRRKTNILLLGVDSNGSDADLWEGTRTDTIILMNIDPRTKTVNAISIPRDSKVYLPDGNGIQKINAAHAIGGIRMIVRTVEETLGVKIDRYIVFHDQGVRAMVKALGGVDIYVEKNMKYDDYAGKLHINISKGKHHLTDKDVVEYLRFRHDAMGDIGRTKRQQWFLRGLLSSMKKPETIVKIPKIVSVVNKYVKTDMTPYEMSQYAGLATHFDMDNIEVAMLPGAPNKHGHVSYWILDPEKTQEVINRLIYRRKYNVVKESYTASIVSTSKKSEDAKELKRLLEENNIEVVCTGATASTHSQFVAHSKYVTIDYYADLKKQIPQVKSKQFVYEPANYLCAKSDFTIVLADEN